MLGQLVFQSARFSAYPPLEVKRNKSTALSKKNGPTRMEGSLDPDVFKVQTLKSLQQYRLLCRLCMEFRRIHCKRWRDQSLS